MISRFSHKLFSTSAKSVPLRLLTPAQKESYDRDGFLVIKNILPQKYREGLKVWGTELEQSPEVRDKWMKYYEVDANTGKRQLCRIENFTPFYEGLRELTVGLICDISSELFEETAVIYKEKINFKLPNGSGFNAHQDHHAFITFGGTKFLTVLVPIDPNTRESGGLDFAYGKHTDVKLMPQNSDGSLRTDVQAQLNWFPVDANEGDLVFFHSFAPHRSDINTSKNMRRNLYLTYGVLREGDNREQYYREKRIAFPPECERDPNKDYSQNEKIYNVANPIK